jgi:hypothetical protein
MRQDCSLSVDCGWPERVLLPLPLVGFHHGRGDRSHGEAIEGHPYTDESGLAKCI